MMAQFQYGGPARLPRPGYREPTCQAPRHHSAWAACSAARLPVTWPLRGLAAGF